MRRQILGHAETMGYTKLESLDWCLRTINLTTKECDSRWARKGSA